MVKVAVEPDHPDYAKLMGGAAQALRRWTFRCSGAGSARACVSGTGSATRPVTGKPSWGTVREADEMLGLQTTGTGLRATPTTVTVSRHPRRYPIDWVFCSRNAAKRVSRAVRQLAAGREGRVDSTEVAMIDPSDVELAAMKKCLKAFGEAAGEIGFTKPLGDYSEAEALQVIDAIVTCYTEAMVAHHEASKFPPVRGMTPAPDPLGHARSRIWRTTCPGKSRRGRSHDRLQLLIEHLGSGHRPGGHRAAAGSRPPVRAPVPRGLAPRRGLRASAAVRVRQGTHRPRA